MRFNELFQLGLTKAQARVLDALINNGETKASEIAKIVKHPRGVVYKLLDELLALSLAEKIEKSRGVTFFRPCHPNQLEKLLETKQNEINKNKKIFEEILPTLVSVYNLSMSKPGIKFYEGEDGFKKILYDTLTSKTEVYMMINTQAVSQEKKFSEINEEYKKKREKLGVIKKIIRFGKKPLLDENLGEIYESITKIKYTDKESSDFKASIQVYDNKVSYQIMEKEKIIGILIEDSHIYEMHKAFFELMWEKIT
jgi:HTH-type transcriptional regulator, sugar sensing transcriptional regulator